MRFDNAVVDGCAVKQCHSNRQQHPSEIPDIVVGEEVEINQCDQYNRQVPRRVM